MRSYSLNSIIAPAEGSELLTNSVRVLGFVQGNVIVIDLKPNPTKPWLINEMLLSEEIVSGLSIVAQEKPLQFLIRDENEISEKEKATREKNWDLIKEFVQERSPRDILISSFGGDVSRHASKVGVHRKQIYRLLYRYWSLGQVKNAFLWNTESCGAPGKAKNRSSGIVPGRPEKYRGVKVDGAILLDEKHLNFIRIAYGRYAAGKCGTIRDGYTWMQSTFYRSIAADGTKGEIVKGSYPSFGQFSYNGKKFFDELYTLKKRSGSIRWNKDLRALEGEASQGLTGPFQQYEIDSTIADVYLVHRINRNWLIGRPVLYVVVDSFSRMIVGIHIGLEGPSWNGARHALYNAFTSKVDFCKRYGIEITEEEWPCHHLPVNLVADRAELLSDAGETMTSTLGVVLSVPPPYRPDWKSIVESRFRLINEGLDLKFMPGGVDARRMERGDRDYELDAILDLDEFTQLVISGVLLHNKHLHLPDLMTPEMIVADVYPTPINIWNWGLSHSLVNEKIVSPSQLKIGLLPSKECRISRGGIIFQGLLYNCELAKRDNWAAFSHNIKTQYVRVWYDPNSMENCWVRNGSEFEPLSLAPGQSERYAGYRMEEVIDILHAIKKPSPAASFEKAKDYANLKERQDAVVAKAITKLEGTPKAESKRKFKSSKKLNRDRESQLQRDFDTADLNQLRMSTSPEIASTENQCEQNTNSSVRRSSFLRLVKSDSQETES
jgi:hypothetical protein